MRVTQMGMGVVTVAAQRSNFSVNESNHRLDELQSALARRSPLWANADSAAARIETRTSPRAIRAARPARYDPVVATQGAAGPDPRTVLAASEPRLAVFAPENLLTRLIVVLDAEAQVFQLGINLDAVGLTGINAPEQTGAERPMLAATSWAKQWPEAVDVRHRTIGSDWRHGLRQPRSRRRNRAVCARRRATDRQPRRSTLPSPCLTRW